jgi:hypothetical protein
MRYLGRKILRVGSTRVSTPSKKPLPLQSGHSTQSSPPSHNQPGSVERKQHSQRILKSAFLTFTPLTSEARFEQFSASGPVAVAL